MEMKKKRVLLAVILVFLVLIAVGCYLFFARQSVSAEVMTGDGPGEEWMAQIEDERLLTDLTLPGSHDSCAWNSDFSYFSQCQYTGIEEQLAMGVRYLDIRISLNKERNGLVMTHSVATCREGESPFGKVLTLEKVVADCRSFLQQHPSETVVFCVKPEDEQGACRELFLELLEKERVLWYTEDRMPALGEARGKLILASRFSEEYSLGQGMSFQWPQQNNKEPEEEPFFAGSVNESTALYVQDRYCYDTEDKWAAVLYGLDSKGQEIGERQAVVLQFLSTKGTKWQGHPHKYAKELNQRFLEKELVSGRNYGWIIVDFAVPQLIEHIYRVNM